MIDIQKRAKALLPALKTTMRAVLDLRMQPDFTIFTKSDESPVTSADLWANDFLLTEMAKLFPGERLIGEESDDKSYSKGVDLLWYIDPIDGTKNYISGVNPFHILIGCCLNGEPVLGICAYPENGKIAVGGSGFSAQLWDDAGNTSDLKRSPIWNDDRNYSISLKGMTDHERSFIRMNGFTKATYVHQHPTMMGAAYGISDAYIDHRTIHWWDLAGPAAIMRSLGYEVGKTYDNTCAMNDGSLSSSRFHCLPNRTPLAIKKLLYHPEAS